MKFLFKYVHTYVRRWLYVHMYVRTYVFYTFVQILTFNPTDLKIITFAKYVRSYIINIGLPRQ